MLLTDILTPSRVRLDIPADDKREAIAHLVDLLDAEGVLSDRDLALQAVLAREETRSTGIGAGLAVPHGKCAAVSELVMAMGRTRSPLQYGSPDNQPVSLIALLLSPPDKTGPHIQLLARISRLLSTESLRSRLLGAQTPEEFYHLLEEYQGRHVAS
ncbi:MAG: PTS sugar transporter subunit IIA [Phycisphaerae bacterium]